MNNNHFATVLPQTAPRSSFSRPYRRLMTMDAGYIYPIFVDEVVPSDMHTAKLSIFARLATPIVPIMDNLYCDVHFFYVPTRLVWPNIEKQYGAQDSPTDSTDYLTPIIQVPNDPMIQSGFPVESIYDYMGIPPMLGAAGVDGAGYVVAPPLRAYNKIWNDWYRDENTQPMAPVPTGDGPDDWGDYVLQRRNKRADYFTSGLPWPMKGPQVRMPIGVSAPVVSNGLPVLMLPDGASERNLIGYNGSPNNQVGLSGSGLSGNKNLAFGSETGLEANLAEGLGPYLSAVREATALTHLLERDARGGTRFTEILRSHYGVISPDFRLQRSEFLGGGTTRVNFHPVPQTSESGSETPQGNLAAFATVNLNTNGFSKSFVEPGYIIGLASIRADYTYQQGLDKMWSRRSRLDTLWPEFANLSEQAILNKEIFWTGVPEVDNAAFAFQERYGEYKYKNSQVIGKMRSYVDDSLDVWHLAQEFANSPTFNYEFLWEDPPIDRVIATPTEPQFIVDLSMAIRSVRPLPMFSIPGLKRL